MVLIRVITSLCLCMLDYGTLSLITSACLSILDHSLWHALSLVWFVIALCCPFLTLTLGSSQLLEVPIDLGCNDENQDLAAFFRVVGKALHMMALSAFWIDMLVQTSLGGWWDRLFHHMTQWLGVWSLLKAWIRQLLVWMENFQASPSWHMLLQSWLVFPSLSS